MGERWYGTLEGVLAVSLVLFLGRLCLGHRTGSFVALLCSMDCCWFDWIAERLLEEGYNSILDDCHISVDIFDNFVGCVRSSACSRVGGPGSLGFSVLRWKV